MRIELTTSSLPRKCSTTELQRLFHCRRRQYSKWSGRPGSNRPPEAWKATALPNELLPLLLSIIKELVCGQSRVRTYVLVREQIYSLSPLTARPSALFIFTPTMFEPVEGFEPPTSWLQISCSDQLSYTGICGKYQCYKELPLKHTHTGIFFRKAKVMEFV